MKPIFKLIVALLAATAMTGHADAQQLTGTLKKIKDTGSIVIGHRESSIPFSYYDDKQKVVGYAVDLCLRIVDAVKTHLKMDKIDIKYNPVTSATRIPLMANGTIDLECGSTTNNLTRQKQVSYTITHFVTATRFVSKTVCTKIRKGSHEYACRFLYIPLYYCRDERRPCRHLRSARNSVMSAISGC